MREFICRPAARQLRHSRFPTYLVLEWGMNKPIAKETPVAEMSRLSAELAEGRKRLAAAVNVEPKGNIAKDARLTPYLAEAQIVLDIINRIKKLKGMALRSASR